MRGGAHDACYLDRIHFDSIWAAQFFHGQLEHRFKQAEARLANFELRGVHAHGDASRAGRQVVAREGALPPLIEFAIGGERERMRRNHDAFPKPCAPAHRL